MIFCNTNIAFYRDNFHYVADIDFACLYDKANQSMTMLIINHDYYSIKFALSETWNRNCGKFYQLTTSSEINVDPRPRHINENLSESLSKPDRILFREAYSSFKKPIFTLA